MLATIVLAALGAATLLAGCTSPPQVVEIAPARGGQGVPSNADVRIRFDRDVDRHSVEAHFRVIPDTAGLISWPSRNLLVYHHDAFQPATTYTVRLEAGYRDLAGTINTLGHGWTFRTEPAPLVTGTTPAGGERSVDPATVFALTFSREMDPVSLEAAVSLSPSTRVTTRRDPGDPRRVLVAPAGLLSPDTGYSLTVTRDALDIDGNRLGAGVAVPFATGAARPLKHWVTVVTADGGDPAGVYVVDEARLPREVISLGARHFSWSVDGSRMLVESQGGAWFDVGLAGAFRQLPFTARWAAFLAPGLGYVALEGDRLFRVAPGGEQTAIAAGVVEAAVDPTGTRVAYAGGAAGSEVWNYTVELRTHERIQVEAAAVDGLTWAPDASRLAYRLQGNDSARALIRVRDLDGHSEPILTVAIGRVGLPAWVADSRHVVVDATVGAPGAAAARVFRVSAISGAPGPLTADQAIPTPVGLVPRSPSPSPDGRQLAFIADVDGLPQAWLMNVDGTAVAPLTVYDRGHFPYSVLALTWTRT